MALTVNWRWNAPQFTGEDAQANSMREGILGIGKGIADMMRNTREEKWKEQAQKNWELSFANNADQWQKQFDRSGEQWQKQFDQNKAVQDFTMNRQRTQDEWLNKWYEQFFGDLYVDDPKERRYRELMAKYGNLSGNAGLVMSGLDPQLF
jgi:hypothetical protein